MALKNTEEWNKLHEDPRFWPKYPSERVIQWAFRTFAPSDGGALRVARILDHGCGAGRHAIFLAENGFTVDACDVSSKGLNVARMRTVNKELDELITYKLYDGITLPYEDASFDGLVSYGVLYYLVRENLQGAVDEIYRVLKKGGKALVVVRSADDSRATSIKGRAENEKNMELLFLLRTEIHDLFGKFSVVNIDQQRQTYGEEVDDDFIITLIK